MGCSKAFSRQQKYAKHPCNVTSHIGFNFVWMFREEIWSGPKKSKNVPKTAKIEGYNSRFRTFPWPEIRMARDAFYRYEMSFKSSQVAWNEYMDAFTFILRQYWVSLEMKKCGVQRLFEPMQMVRNTRATLQVTSPFLGTFQENMTISWESKNVLKIDNIEGYNTRFSIFSGPELRTPWDAF